MKAIHVNHTMPFLLNPANRKKDYQIQDFELITTILSALKWREFNGKIKLYTDIIGYDYYYHLDLLDIWNEIDTNTLENIRENINFYSFWAAGKLFALRNETSPIFILDTDFIVWKKINKFINNINDTIVIHKEELFEEVYIKKEFLKTPENYKFNSKFSWLVKPCNAAFIYFGNQTLLDFYLYEAVKFMNNNTEEALENTSQMVFAEQRLLSMCADYIGVEIKTFLGANQQINQNYFTHIWGYKDIMKKKIKERKKFCIKSIKRIITDYPYMESRLRKINMFSEYLKSIDNENC